MSTTIPIGLEIRRLVWKDDAFRMADHESGLFRSHNIPAGMLGWWDNTTGNAITFTNINGFTTDTLGGGVTTYGPFGSASPVFTNGDELMLPGSFQIEKDFPEALPGDIIGSVRLRAKSLSGTPTLTITLLNSSLSPMFPTFSVTLSSTIYTHYTFTTFPSSDVWGIRLECSADASVAIDYVALGGSDYLNQGGVSLNVSIPKQTQSQTIPNDTDIIQQLGISSRSKAVVIEKVTTDTFNWLEDKLERAIPIELLTPTQQATGYITDLKRHSEAGWVSRPLPSSDSLHLTNTARQLYDISFSLVKADGELNIDLTNPIIPPPPPTPLGFSLAIPTNDGTRANDSYQRHMWYMAGLWWVFYVQDTTLGNGFFFRTTNNPLTAWSAATRIITMAEPPFQEFNTGIWFDGTYLYYVTCDGASAPFSTTNVYFRQGTPHSDGTITWSAAEQTLTGLYGNEYFSGVVWVFTDSNGYSWAMNGRAFTTHEGVLRNANTDGTWSTNLSHYAPAPTGATRLGAVPLPTGGQVVMFWTDSSSHKHKFQLYNGSSWGTVVSGTGVDYDGISFSAVAVGSQVHLTYVNTSSQIVYMVYDSASNTILQESVIPGANPEAGNSNPPISVYAADSSITIIMWYNGSYCYATTRSATGTYSTISQIFTGGSVGGRSISGWDASGGYVTYWFSSSVAGGADVILYWSLTPPS
jgi:hypothetical protein